MSRHRIADVVAWLLIIGAALIIGQICIEGTVPLPMVIGEMLGAVILYGVAPRRP